MGIRQISVANKCLFALYLSFPEIEGDFMSRCELTGKAPVVKNLVSHSNIKTKSTAQPNVQKKRLFSKALNMMVRLQVSASSIRDMEHMGGFDTYLLNLNDSKLSARALDIKNRIRRKISRKAKTSKADKKAKV